MICLFCPITEYGINYLRESHHTEKIYKKPIKITVGAKPGNLCRSLSGRSEIFSLPWEYIVSLMNFVPNNKKKEFQTNSSVHSNNIRNEHQIYNLPAFHASGKAHSMLVPKFQRIFHCVMNLRTIHYSSVRHNQELFQ